MKAAAAPVAPAAPAAPIPVVIVDDEPLARHKLRLFFEGVPDFAVQGEAGDGPTALRMIEAVRPRLLCLDIRLPGMSGFDVLHRARPGAAVIFTTAFDRYAVSAFELAAVDYLMKPFSRARFVAAVERARRWLAAADGMPPVERLRAVSEPAHLTRLFVRDGGAVHSIRTADVQHCESNGDDVIVHAQGRRYRLTIPLNDLASRLDAAAFLRIHRRLIVNLDHVTDISPASGSRFAVRLGDGTSLTVSRRRSRLFRRRGV